MGVQPGAEFLPRYSHHRPPPMSAPETIGGQRTISHHAIRRCAADAELALDLDGLQQAILRCCGVFRCNVFFIHPRHELAPCNPNRNNAPN